MFTLVVVRLIVISPKLDSPILCLSLPRSRSRRRGSSMISTYNCSPPATMTSGASLTATANR